MKTHVSVAAWSAALLSLCLLVIIGGVSGAQTREEKIEIEYRSHPALDSERSKYPGFEPGQTVLPAGYTAAPGRKALSTDTILDRDVAIPLRDGTVVYGDVYRPVGSEKVPAILSYGPGGKRNKNPNTVIFTPDSATSGLQAWLAQDPAAWVPYGYAVVNVDPRGSYNSEGTLRYLGHEDAEDGYDIIEFIAALPWCNGKVGMNGNFWDALVQWGIAATRPPHLAAIAPWDAGNNVFRDEFHRGGITMSQPSIHVRSFGPGLEEDMSVMIDKYPLMNAYWQDKIPQIEKIRIPVYQVMSYTTQHTNGDVEAFNQLPGENKWLRVLNGHAWVDLHSEESRADLRRFFDRYLKGEQNGWESTPRVRLAVLDGGGEDIVDRPENEFPLARQEITRLYLDGETGTLRSENPSREATVRYTPAEEGKAVFTMTFNEETEITGYMTLRLWVEAEGADDMDLFARIVKLDASGTPLLQDSLTFQYSGPDGRLRVSQRRLDESRSTPLVPVLAQDTTQPLKEGEIVPVDIPIWPTGMVFHAGQQLQLVIAGHDYMLSRPNDRPVVDIENQGTHILHTGGKYESCLMVPVIPPREDQYLYAGTWTNLPTGGDYPEYAKGIYGWRISSATGSLSSLGLVAKADGPESLTVSPDEKYLYATRHNGSASLPGTPFPGAPPAGVAAYRIDPETGNLEFLNSVDALGDAPAHIGVDPTGGTLVLANYHSGNVVSYRILADGRLSEPVSEDTHTGQGAHGGPHAHGVAFSPDGRILYVADQGVDRVYSYDLDPETGRFTPQSPPYVAVKAGSGPRHLAVHPNGKWVYVNNEQGGTEIFFTSDGGRLTEVQEISIVPEGYTGMVGSAESKISPDGRFLYANSRAHEGIAVFSIDPASGRLTMVQYALTSRAANLPPGAAAGEQEPVDRYAKGARMFAWDAGAAWVASGNLGDNAVVILKRDQETGKLSPTGKIYDVPQPSYVVFAKP